MIFLSGVDLVDGYKLRKLALQVVLTHFVLVFLLYFAVKLKTNNFVA